MLNDEAAPSVQYPLPISTKKIDLVRSTGGLQSRVADNLFWLGRYIERAEGNLRILRAWHGRFAEVDDRGQALLTRVEAYLDNAGLDLSEAALPKSLMRDIDSAVYSAGNIRDRFSPDGWLALNDLAQAANGAKRTMRLRGEILPYDPLAGTSADAVATVLEASAVVELAISST